ncbi:hypothetical protein SHab15497_00045 [Acinetobacter phage SH-Ab 15497]|nr:hypothetical protein SHab15497_00045 [Acinetobacter phage SH-Ab 15497]
MKKLAINLDNNKVIEVVEVNGGWTTCRDIDEGFEFKLRNGKIGEYVAPAEEPKPAKKEKPKAKKIEGYIEPASECPKCGSTEVYHGVIGADGHTVVNEETDWGCHHCDFEMKAADYNENGDKLVKADLDHYVKGAGTTNSGRPTVDIDDVVAKALRGDDLEIIYPKVAKWLKALGRESIGRGAKKMEVTEDNLRTRYGKLNVGMQRMNLGNVLRGAMNDLGVTELPEIE